MPQPTLHTSRLILRPFDLSDAAEVQRLAGSLEVADTTLNVPHPYEDGMAETWISTHAEDYETLSTVTYAVSLQNHETCIIGAVSLVINPRHQRGELGYWIGREHWNQGYCTEAAKALADFGFESLKLHKVTAHHLTRNPASGRVMQKIGMQHEGTLKQHILKWDQYEDIECYGLVKL